MNEIMKRTVEHLNFTR